MDSARRLRVCLAGFGAFAESAHVPAYLNSPWLELAAVADPVAARRAAATNLIPGVAVYHSLEHMLNDGELAADVVDICSPPAFHAAQARASLEAGKHVICEKPVAWQSGLLDELLSLADRAGCQLLPAHNYGFSPGIRRWIAAAREDAGGIERVHIDVRRMEHARGTGAWQPDWRRDALAGGGLLLDHGPHAIAIVLRLVERPLRGISAAETGSRADLAMRFMGCEARISLSWDAAGRSTVYEAAGARGVAVLRDYSQLVRRMHGVEKVETFSERSPGEWTRRMLEDYGALLRGACIVDGRRELMQVTEALEMAQASSHALGRWVEAGERVAQ